MLKWSYMIERLTQGKLFWVNLKNPSADEIHAVMSEFELPPALMGDLIAPIPRNYTIEIDTVIKLVMDFPIVKRIDKEHHHEVKFLITKHGLITAQYEEMEALDRFKKEFEVITTLNKANKHVGGVNLFMSLVGELYSACSSKLDYVESILSNTEIEIFKDNERQLVFEIAQTSKKMIAFRHTLLTHHDVFSEARLHFETIYKHAYTTEFDNVNRIYTTLLNRTNGLFEILDALRETNFAMLTAKQNEIMKTLTILAFITFPLTLFTSTFGMNTVTTPIIGEEGDFWIIVSIMVTATVFFFGFFKYKKWM